MNRAAPSRPNADRNRSALIAAFPFGMSVTWNIASVGSIADSVADHYGIGLASVGLFTSVFFLAQVVLQVPGGRLIDRWGPRRVGVAMLMVVVAGNLAGMVVGGVAAALVLRFAVGFATGTAMIAGIITITAAGGGPVAYGTYGGLSLGVGGLAVVLVPALEPAWGWQAPYVSGAVWSAAGILVTLALRPSGRHRRRPRAALWKLLSSRALRRLAALHVATFGLSVILSNWVVALLSRHGHSQRTAGVIGGLILLGGILGRPGGGMMVGRFPHLTRTILGWSMVAGAGGCLLLAMARPTALAAFGAAIMGLASGIPYATILIGAPNIAPDAPGAALAAVVTPAVAAIVIATPLLGMTFALPGAGRLGFVIAAGLWLAITLIMPSRKDIAAMLEPAT